MKFSETLGELIKKSGMTQKEFAQKSGLTEAAISRYLHDNRMPNMEALIKIKGASQCTWEELMGE